MRERSVSRTSCWYRFSFLVQAAFWWVFIRPFEQIQQRLNEICKGIDESKKERQGK